MIIPKVNDKHLSSVLRVATEAALKARKVHTTYYKKLKNIQNKRDLSLVSEADQMSEKVIRDLIRKKFPDIDILGEEEGLESRKKKSKGKNQTHSRWLIDPLDGTTNYIHGYPFFCSSIALEINGEIQVGVVDSVLFKRTYCAVRGYGAFLNNKKISTSKSKTIRESLVATGFSTYGGERLDKEMDVFQKLVQKSRGVRRSGSAALELCLLAEGALDGFWEHGLKPWDTGAGSLIVTEAGGHVTNEKGEKFHPDQDVVVASNGIIHTELLSLIK
jgi:myo-inositol-1(or 4)-monophosphatase